MKALTAEEFLIEKNYPLYNNFGGLGMYYVKEAMIEFAKMHVQEALKQALESIPCLGSSTDIPSIEEVEKAVLNAYPLDLIK